MNKYKLPHSDDILIYNLITKKDYTIRDVAKYFGVSKTTIHRRIHSDLFLVECKDINRFKYREYLYNILDRHFKYKYKNGGEATKLKYSSLKESNV